MTSPTVAALGHSPYPKSLTIIGLGNEFLTDDGVGIRVVRELRNRLLVEGVVFEELSVGGLQLLDHIVGTEECIIIDAITSGVQPAGTLYRFIQDATHEPIKLTSSHQIDLSQVLSLAKLLGAALPKRLTVYGIEANDVTTFQDSCTNQVSSSIPRLVDLICRDINNDASASPACVGAWQIIQDIGTN
jgi:hydrogenase maturation protease